MSRSLSGSEVVSGGTGPAVRSESFRTVKVAERVAMSLLNHITHEGLGAGDPLPNERDMIESFGVSRGTLREALRLLETQGVVTIKPGPGGGPVVRAPTPDVFAGSTTMLMQFIGVTYGEVIAARAEFEPPVAASAAVARTQAQVAQLRELTEQMRGSVQVREVFQAHYGSYHLLLGEMTGNRVLLMSNMVFRTIWDALARELEERPADRKRTAEIHEQLTEAIAAREESSAREASEAYVSHIGRWVKRWHPYLLDRTVNWIPLG